MAMTPEGLSAALKTSLDAKFGVEPTNGGSTARQDFCDTVAAAVVTFLQTNATVVGTAVCAAGGGPVTGTLV